MNQIITLIAAPSAEESLAHYRRLKYHEKQLGDQEWLFFDRMSCFILSAQRDARHGLRIYADDPTALRQLLDQITTTYDKKDGFCCMDPSGVYQHTTNEQLPTVPDQSAITNSLCGKNYGLGIESGRLAQSVEHYELLGYKAEKALEENTMYYTMTHPTGPPITLYRPTICPHAFYSPSYTFFNGKEGNKKVIANLREAGTQIRQEITWFNDAGDVDNIIISDPGGFHSFIFNDG